MDLDDLQISVRTTPRTQGAWRLLHVRLGSYLLTEVWGRKRTRSAEPGGTDEEAAEPVRRRASLDEETRAAAGGPGEGVHPLPKPEEGPPAEGVHHEGEPDAAPYNADQGPDRAATLPLDSQWLDGM